MEEAMIFALRYPIGKYQTHEVWSEKLKDQYIGNIADLPYLIDLNTKDITKEQLAYLYRPEGWSINEVVHHLVDSHMNAFIRFKLALTEDNPVIKPYDEAAFVKLGDCHPDSFEDAKTILNKKKKKWVALLASMSMEDFQRTYFHPESGKKFTLEYVLGLYSWHCLHHLAHIKQALDKKYA